MFMEKVEYDEIPWSFNNSENVHIGFSPKLVFNGFDVCHAKLSPKQTLKMHYHERNGGDEIFCFFNGGHFRLLTLNNDEIINTEKPVYISFKDKEAHSVENLSDEDLEFQLIYSPPFKDGEVKH